VLPGTADRYQALSKVKDRRNGRDQRLYQASHGVDLAARYGGEFLCEPITLFLDIE
jgi:hypothetical protein